MADRSLNSGADSTSSAPGKPYGGIILYGPPASGKDTVTAALESLDSRYAYFHRLKVGPGRTTGYRLTDETSLQELRDEGLLLYESQRYDATYAIDRPELERLRAERRIPVLHIGQMAGIDAIHRYPCRWLDVLLWCSKDETEKRLRARGSSDTGRRLVAWDETLEDLGAAGREPRFALSFRTDLFQPDRVARGIDSLISNY